MPTLRAHGVRVVGLLIGFVWLNLLVYSSAAANSEVLTANPVWRSTDTSYVNAVAWGDMDNDGDLDVAAVGKNLALYRNEAGTLAAAPFWTKNTACGKATSVAWGDLDRDGDLDLVVGTSSCNLVYDNLGSDKGLTADPSWVSTEEEETQGVALGDMNGDGYLDLAVANGTVSSSSSRLCISGIPNRVYRNQQGRLETTASWPPAGVTSDADCSTSVAWGDINGDGKLDLAVGNRSIRAEANDSLISEGYNKVYLNDNNTLQTTPYWQATVNRDTTSIAWGDLNDDDKLDLAVGNLVVPFDWCCANDQIYLNTGTTLATTPTWEGGGIHTATVAWGDVDRDGDLDLATADTNTHLAEMVFRNHQNQIEPTAIWTASVENPAATSVAWGDVDSDGDLDLLLGTSENGVWLYRNETVGFATPISFGDNSQNTVALAWGDVDGDNDLDLAVSRAGFSGAPDSNLVYENDANVLQPNNNWTFGDKSADGIAWGDVDGDGDLDLAIGRWRDPDTIYRFENGRFAAIAGWPGDEVDYTNSVAWGDMDGDGDLDLAVGNGLSNPNKVYRNHNGNLESTASWMGTGYQTQAVAWGDVDSDGDLDLAIGNSNGPNQLYLNERGQLTQQPAWEAATTDNTNALAWGDVDGDGGLDLAVGNSGAPNKVYFSHGGSLEKVASWASQEIGYTGSIALGDTDGDGDLDLVVSDTYEPKKLYLNQNGQLPLLPTASLGDTGANGLALGDVDNDGDLDLADGKTIAIFKNQQAAARAYPGVPPAALTLRLNSNEPVPTFRQNLTTLALAPANFFALAAIRADGTIPIPYTLYHPGGEPVATVRGYYSVDGGGVWLPAVATSDTLTQELASGSTPATAVEHVYIWDVFKSGFLGQSDNVVFRLIAVPTVKPRVNDVAGPYQRGALTAQSYPFRVRGAQVRVVDANQAAITNALVYRLPKDQLRGALPIADQADTPYRTDGQGYLQGRGQLAVGDQLVALVPITATESYTLYYMSAAPTLNGLDVYTVTNAGVQTLTVSSAHPLLLLNLDVALEWDARKDTAFLKQLEFDLRRTSEFLFDATDGQAALGEITLYHNKEQWERADLRIYASNAMIPNADPGGIVTSEVHEIIASNPFINATTPYSITYQPGRIRMGAVWNRFGEATGTLGEDWPRTLAHEIGHYAFYLYDNYLGLKDGVVAPVDTCTGTVMTDQYREDFSEFHTVDNWATKCGETISAQRSGRADWQTITRFYPWLKMPSGPANPGPVTLPLAVTQIESRFASTPTLPLDVAVFDLVDGNGTAQVSGSHAQAVLYTEDGRLLDLGHPVVDKLEARGAHVGDRLCVYDLQAGRLGCETITANDNFLTLAQKAGWQPEIVVSPVTSRTVSVLLSNVTAGLTLQGKLYPENSAATAVTDFVPWTGGAYSTTFQLATGVLAGHIQVWVNETDSPANPRRESLTSYALGGSPGKLKKPPKGNKRTLDSTTQAGSEDVTPAIAPDGQVLIYGNVSFSDGEFYALQKVDRLPVAPLWTTVVGDGYRILKSAKAPDLVNTSILFRYRGQDVPAGEENFLSLYFWDEAKAQWRRLPTVLNRAVNEASAQAPGPGLYVLMSSLEIPLQQAGWNLLAYPVQQTRPVTEALASIAGNYSLVYSYVITDTIDPWKLYAPAAPAYVNDLRSLTFGQGYWINATQVTTWLVKGPDQATLQAAATNGLPTPPATFYGAVLPGKGLTPAVGQPVQALINGALCGQSQTQLFAGQIVYSLNVVGDGTGNPACIGAGQRVVITVAGLPLEEVFWQNDVAQPVVSNGPKIYLPTIWR